MIFIKFNPVSNKKLYIQIYNQILSEIQLGSFKVGDKLPSERELCEQFGVSRAPVRQALSALEMNGVIYSRQGEGVFVKNTTITTEGTLSMKSASPEDIVEARMHIEPLIIHFAALRATDQEIEELKQTIKKMEEETRSGVYVPETDEQLHMGIARASHNDLFVTFMSSITNAMKQQEMWRFIRDRTVTRSDYREINFQEHKMIIKALEERNSSEAVTRMTDHMQNLYDRYWKS
ncbi:FadR/GntR family transcriptional regulator [Bacillus safensis]|uniref:FadR/GntR family transcriptional regulator n=1 Tax=Bacillus safensis TaxID=561879 RepID=UPI0005970177|nr:FadR/GntR family transcriptional regulator [Bacillus safensis]MCP8952727.1 FadR family transcriptional regulator [Bacillus safensis]MCU0157002.1 FadR family transcriptional regulator [Bacillus safensis]MEC3734919.1 FadR/GntR family transcriptional regulator [Bacillus safensis]WJE41070.1 FadR/GntR family transcriptional regulator [Bacillus safensis]